jgi:hypothetical protein
MESFLDEPAQFNGANYRVVKKSLDDYRIKTQPRWDRKPARYGKGWRYFKPGTKESTGLRLMRGNPRSPDPLHQGPRLYTFGVMRPVTVLLEGNPALP